MGVNKGGALDLDTIMWGRGATGVKKMQRAIKRFSATEQVQRGGGTSSIKKKKR